MTVWLLVRVVVVWRRATGAARELVQGHKAKQATAQHVSSNAFCRNATVDCSILLYGGRRAVGTRHVWLAVFSSEIRVLPWAAWY